jgi:hypothetical protein
VVAGNSRNTLVQLDIFQAPEVSLSALLLVRGGACWMDHNEVKAVAAAIAGVHHSDPDGWLEVATNIVTGVDALFAHRQAKVAASMVLIDTLQAKLDEALDEDAAAEKAKQAEAEISAAVAEVAAIEPAAAAPVDVEVPAEPVSGLAAPNVERIRPNPNRTKKAKAAAE